MYIYSVQGGGGVWGSGRDQILQEFKIFILPEPDSEPTQLLDYPSPFTGEFF